MKGRKPNMKQAGKALRAIRTAPKWLSVDAKAEWKRVLPDLVERRILTDADLGSLENYCVAIGQVREMERILQKEGHVYAADNGLLKRHPAGVILSDAMTRARLLAAEMGLTPVSRSRPAIGDDEDEDSLVD
ncbi:MAG: phage terminase small subunit P27 family [Xanthobacteraceae bacterium]|nr:phage terminase small subunit P27 family [Xanthobacteraceae bacterium]